MFGYSTSASTLSSADLALCRLEKLHTMFFCFGGQAAHTLFVFISRSQGCVGGLFFLTLFLESGVLVDYEEIFAGCYKSVSVINH